MAKIKHSHGGWGGNISRYFCVKAKQKLHHYNQYKAYNNTPSAQQYENIRITPASMLSTNPFPSLVHY